jgi:hypothetical protein
MSDPNDAFHRTPLSSSSTNTSGTQALNVVIEAESAGHAADEAKMADALPVDAAANENMLSEGDTATGMSSEIPAYPALDAELATMPSATQGAIADLPEQTYSSGEPAFSGPMEIAHEAAPDPVAGLDEPESEPAPAPLLQAEREAPLEIEDLRAAVRETIVQNEGKEERMLAMFEKATVDFKSVMEDARNDAARLTFKLMEFAQANLRNNIEFARDYASARSVPDIFNVQTAYIKRQMDLVNQQTEELQKLTAEITSRKASQFQFQVRRT